MNKNIRINKVKISNKLKIVLFLFFSAQGAMAWTLPVLGGVENKYSAALTSYLKSTPDKSKIPSVKENEVSFQCYMDQEDDFYVGAAQRYLISAEMSEIEKNLLKFEDYPKWFDGLVAGSSVKIDDLNYLASFEQYVPFPLVPNIKYKMIYKVEKANGETLFRYQFSEGDSIKAYDGFILLQQFNPKTVLVTEFDFISANWGIAKVLGKTDIWIQSLEGMYQSDYALKLKSENPSRADKEVLEVSKKVAKDGDLKKCFTERQSFLPVQSNK